eukprot:1377790-Pyramimonas_sp.AAC.1
MIQIRPRFAPLSVSSRDSVSRGRAGQRTHACANVNLRYKPPSSFFTSFFRSSPLPSLFFLSVALLGIKSARRRCASSSTRACSAWSWAVGWTGPSSSGRWTGPCRA